MHLEQCEVRVPGPVQSGLLVLCPGHRRPNEAARAVTPMRGPRRLFSRQGKHVLFLLLLAAAVMLGGCGSIGLVPVLSGPTADKAAAVKNNANLRHDLAVISLDFDPPLRVLQVDKVPSNLVLLVAVDNLGGFTERKVGVTVELRAEGSDDVLVRKETTVESIAPGHATVVKLGNFPSIPPRNGYVLVVSLDQVPGELETQNNSMVLPLHSVLLR